MYIFHKRNRWKIILFLLAVSIVFFTLWYTQRLAASIAKEEIKKATEIANAYMVLNNIESDELELANALEKIKVNENIPVIWSNQKEEILASKNFDSLKISRDDEYLIKELNKLKTKQQFIEIELPDNEQQYLYYKDSDLLVSIRKYPFYVLALVALFFVISFAAFTSARRAEQNQVWVGLAKETAHQLGTPLSSLTAWIEILREKLTSEDDEMMFDEMQKDIDRLVLIAERFSKIGSVPELDKHRLVDVLQNGVDYISKRASKNIHIFLVKDMDVNLFAMLNPPLFEWVLENIMKNALDAMDDKGEIHIQAFEKEDDIFVDITDTGKGITKNNFEQIFTPGFSTKKRGWGLGLTLARRIIEEYHHGKIFVKESSSKGTTFRIQLKAAM
ncbi:MAG TPA: HAMP domain-containing sensor histidine kinase [Chitinophagales bacterium]|nr:HAMP domain-containing sensor histidine kinase [Chitinophagales bacterium]HQW79845.1 HAMP domain-containing sensor histidine kinase [Chitinophagales bacterium]